MKKALFIHPDYCVPGIDKRLKYVLRQLGVLPPDLHQTGYTPDGFEVDCGILSKILGPGFDSRQRCSEVTRQDFLKELEWLVTEDTQVAVLFFSGHGENELGIVHGSLVCSFNQHVSDVAISEVVKKSGFKGTLIVILHMCEAAGVACTSEAPSLKGTAQRDGAKVANSSPPTPSSEYFNITLLATGSPFFKTYGYESGSYFMAALGELFAREKEQQRPVTYERLDALFYKYWPSGAVKYLARRPVVGTFGSTARDPSGEEALACKIEEQKEELLTLPKPEPPRGSRSSPPIRVLEAYWREIEEARMEARNRLPHGDATIQQQPEPPNAAVDAEGAEVAEVAAGAAPVVAVEGSIANTAAAGTVAAMDVPLANTTANA